MATADIFISRGQMDILKKNRNVNKHLFDFKKIKLS